MRDIADAMILSRLFTALFAAGVVVVATSNVAPDDLYKDGLNRALFLPFIALIEERLEVVELDARTDYRLEKLQRAPVYYTPLGPKADAALDAAFLTLTGHERGEPMQIELLGRHLDVPQAIDGVARFDFDALCRRPLGAADYLKLAQRFHTLVLDRIPVIAASERNEAKRFIILIDALYDMRVKLIASAAGEPETLYSGATARRRSNSRAPPRGSTRCARPTTSRCRTGARAARRRAISAASRRREARTGMDEPPPCHARGKRIRACQTSQLWATVLQRYGGWRDVHAGPPAFARVTSCRALRARDVERDCAQRETRVARRRASRSISITRS